MRKLPESRPVPSLDEVEERVPHRTTRISHRPRQRGDVVCVQDEKKTRLNWSLGKVERLLVGRDGKVRAAVVQVINKPGKPRELRRPIQTLSPLSSSLRSNIDQRQSGHAGLVIVEHAEQENTPS